MLKTIKNQYTKNMENKQKKILFQLRFEFIFKSLILLIYN